MNEEEAEYVNCYISSLLKFIILCYDLFFFFFWYKFVAFILESSLGKKKYKKILNVAIQSWRNLITMKSEERFWTILNITILIAGNALVHEVYSQENNGDI